MGANRSTSRSAASVDVDPREFKTGLLGWSLRAKTAVEVDGLRAPVQVSLNITVIGSKELPT